MRKPQAAHGGPDARVRGGLDHYPGHPGIGAADDAARPQAIDGNCLIKGKDRHATDTGWVTPRGTMTAMVSRFLQVGKAVSCASERLNVTGSERTIPVDGVV